MCLDKDILQHTDASELFVETPTDLMLQSSTWSNYKQHNTAKYLVSVTPNGAISFISSAFVGSISDPELTCCCGLLVRLNLKENICYGQLWLYCSWSATKYWLTCLPFRWPRSTTSRRSIAEKSNSFSTYTRWACHWQNEKLHYLKRGISYKHGSYCQPSCFGMCMADKLSSTTCSTTDWERNKRKFSRWWTWWIRR